MLESIQNEILLDETRVLITEKIDYLGSVRTPFGSIILIIVQLG